MKKILLAMSSVIVLQSQVMAKVGPEPTTWSIDTAHSSTSFAIKHMMISTVRGQITGVTGTIEYDGKNVKSMKVSADIDVNTLNTNEANRDKHLKSADFFDVAKYPTISFKSKKVVAGNGKTFKMIGDLTMHGVTKEVTLDVDGPSAEIKDPMGGTKIGASATARLNRKDFGIEYNKVLETGGLALGDEVNISIDVEAGKKVEAKTSK